MSFGPWGRHRNPTDWTYTNVPAPKLTDPSFTLHEELPEFGLINMNGRTYAPVLARFLNADPVIQAPGNAQNYNSYSYCFNNPLSFTDPSGYANRPILDDGDEYIEGRFKGSRFFDGYDYGPIGYGMPGEGGNGTGLNGVYYDWRSGTYRDVYAPGSSLGFSYAYHGAIVPSGGLFNLFNKDADGTCTGIEYSEGTLYISSGNKWVGNSITYIFNTGVYNKIPYDNRPSIETAWWGMGYHMDDVLGLGFGNNPGGFLPCINFPKIPWSNTNHGSNVKQIANFLSFHICAGTEWVRLTDAFSTPVQSIKVGQVGQPFNTFTIKWRGNTLTGKYSIAVGTAKGHKFMLNDYMGVEYRPSRTPDKHGIMYEWRYFGSAESITIGINAEQNFKSFFDFIFTNN